MLSLKSLKVFLLRLRDIFLIIGRRQDNIRFKLHGKGEFKRLHHTIKKKKAFYLNLKKNMAHRERRPDF